MSSAEDQAARRVRDRRRGKHHLTADDQTTLCGRPVPPAWEGEDKVVWADEDECSLCTKAQPAL